MKGEKYFAVIVIISSLFYSCDTRKEAFDGTVSDVLCYTAAGCSASSGVSFGMVGDSWTDLALGFSGVYTLRTYLEDVYGFSLVGATVAGQRMSTLVEMGLHLKVIETAGPNIRYMLVSLGGNDFIQDLDPVRFTADEEAEWERVFSSIQGNLLKMIREGNAYKKDRYGGQEILWIVHGYDYINPDNPYYSDLFNSIDGCRVYWLYRGFTDVQVDSSLTDIIDRFNMMLQETSYQEPFMRHLDLRGILGGPPLSDPGAMLDCIHPTSAGFGAIAARYVELLDYITDHER